MAELTTNDGSPASWETVAKFEKRRRESSERERDQALSDLRALREGLSEETGRLRGESQEAHRQAVDAYEQRPPNYDLWATTRDRIEEQADRLDALLQSSGGEDD